MKKLLTLAILVIGIFLFYQVWASPKPKANLGGEFVTETFIDYGTPTHAGQGPHPTTESTDFQLVQGGIRWFSGSEVKYQITGNEPLSGANLALENAVQTWDDFIIPRSFTRDDNNPTPNPCGGNNKIQWAMIDGPNNVLAMTNVCRNVATKEIVGFVVTMDSSESWATDGSSTSFDVENIASHEFGHVAGLGHDNPPRSGCLTMYKFAGLGETQKRTLGWGDKLGMNILYYTNDITPGPGCGN